jgi:hypothetical protein
VLVSSLVTLALVVAMPPAFWLCVVGGVMVVGVLITNSSRTGQWMSWQNEGSLSLAEVRLAAVGVVLLVVPLAAALVRAWLK